MDNKIKIYHPEKADGDYWKLIFNDLKIGDYEGFASKKPGTSDYLCLEGEVTKNLEGKKNALKYMEVLGVLTHIDGREMEFHFDKDMSEQDRDFFRKAYYDGRTEIPRFLLKYEGKKIGSMRSGRISKKIVKKHPELAEFAEMIRENLRQNNK